ncbi:MAG: hypothetical protein RH862_11680 [Leptospiraceae bacterium]
MLYSYKLGSKTKVALWALFLCFVQVSSLQAEQTENSERQSPTEEEESVQDRPDNSQPEEDHRNTDTVLPVQAPAPMGFHKDRMSISLLFGAPISAPSGSFISHEKSYDNYLLYQIEGGQIATDLLGQQARYYNPSYDSGAMFISDLEAAFARNFGGGVSFLFSSVSTRRQDVLPWKDSSDRYIMNYPEDRVLYSEGALLGFLSYHPISESRFDPYIKLRAGITFVHGYSHQYTIPDPYTFETDINNGRGSIYGASLGVNVYLNQYSALTLEFTSIGRSISADQFSNRTLNNDYLSVGITLGFMGNN